MRKPPKITTVIPSFNQGKFIERALKSVIRQDYGNKEVIVIDGGSTDNSVELIRKYEKNLSYWISEPDRGQSHAINKGIRKATGEIIFWLNSDDICLPKSFRKVSQVFRKNQNAAMVIGQAYIIDKNDRKIGDLKSYYVSWEELVTNPKNSIRQISTFFSKKVFDELGLVDEFLEYAMDTELMVRFANKYEPIIIEEYLTAYRIHDDTKTSKHLPKGYREVDQTRTKYLINNKLKTLYRERSLKNWTSLSESSTMRFPDSVKCLARAVRIKPDILLSFEFWRILTSKLVTRI